ncbi:hypothetical protein [Pseudoduganella umbonata]|uniref:Uncharacterized protein n=1 Tax=Pseudoduganella umbonata TaxID=864828 RepID=A0A4V1EDB7_9BURK|nr:hypothetical protein [Pseudoduganella umbonata]MBB3221357.1 hypothetical protein [Pseudoduganella umbonata]QCP10521.1 hypothetical protein FCL38_08820 [Pseudoduganella umbonata]
MALADILQAAAAAIALIGAFPWRLLLATVIFLVVAEGLMFIPRAGFVLKLCVASLLAVQLLAMFRVAALGEPPPLAILLDASYLPPASMLVLWLCALVPFALGLAVLAATGQGTGVRYFFGNILRDKPPSPRAFLLFKAVMHVAAAVFTFVAPGIVLKGYIGWNALEQGLVAALLYWQAPLAVLLLSVAFDAFATWLPKLLPARAAGIVVLVLLLFFVLFLFAFTYTLSAGAFGI